MQEAKTIAMKLLIINLSIMKLLIIFISCLLTVSVIGQDTLSNYSPSLSFPICGRSIIGSGIFDSDYGFVCSNGKSRLYYEFTANDSGTLGVDGDFTFRGYTNSSTTTAISTSYRLFGPFDPLENYSSLIETNAISTIEDGGTTTLAHNLGATLEDGKKYVLEITANACEGYIDILYDTDPFFFSCFDDIPCDNCLPKFQPVDDRYVVSAWVKELAGSTSGALNYTHSLLKVTSGAFVDTLYPAGQIIDGWQRIEGIIQTNSIGNLKMELLVSSGTSYFDDIRVFPYDGSMITYVYDPVTLRLMAEMDERNYAKIYEYDEEGKLVRVKKETEKGIMTIQENRENSSTND